MTKGQESSRWAERAGTEDGAELLPGVGEERKKLPSGHPFPLSQISFQLPICLNLELSAVLRGK